MKSANKAVDFDNKNKITLSIGSAIALSSTVGFLVCLPISIYQELNTSMRLNSCQESITTAIESSQSGWQEVERSASCLQSFSGDFDFLKVMNLPGRETLDFKTKVLLLGKLSLVEVQAQATSPFTIATYIFSILVIGGLLTLSHEI